MAAPPRTVHVEPCMGTVFTFDVRGSGAWTEAVADACSWLHHCDALFSTYRPDSAVSRLRDGTLDLVECHPEVWEVLALGEEGRSLTGGLFDVTASGQLDPSGVVKGWAVERASAILLAAGAGRHSVNGGGDVRLVGSPSPGEQWRVGVVSPLDPAALVAVVLAEDQAVATSGTAERGQHILDPRTRLPARGLLSATVVGPSLTTADMLATAAMVAGRDARDWAAILPEGYYLLGVEDSGALWCTSGFPLAGRV